MHSAQELVAQLNALVSLPKVYHRIRDELDSPNGSLLEVGRLLAADPALTARLLRVVNSALYGYGGEIDTVSRAVQILGLQQVHDLVLAMSLGAAFAKLDTAHCDINRFWRGSMICALACSAIARGCGLSSAERLFVLGLLADLGHLAMYQTIPDLAWEAEREAERLNLPVAEVERRLIGCDYAEVGAALADHWKLPPGFAATLGAQLDPRLGGEYCFDAAIVHVATQLARADRCGESSERAAAWVSAAAWQQLAMSPASLQGVREEAELNLAAYLALFFPRLGTV